MKFSATSISTYITCKRKFYHKYVAGLEEEKSEVARAGTVIHDSVHLAKDFEHAKEIAMQHPELPDTYREDILAALERIFSYNKFDKGRDDTEQEIKVNIGGIDFVGILDVVVNRNGKPIGIIDWKFSKSNPSVAKYGIQASMYNMLFREHFGYEPLFIIFFNMRRDKELIIIPGNLKHYEQVILEDIIPEMKQLSDSLSEYPRDGFLRNACKYCSFIDLCFGEGHNVLGTSAITSIS